MSVHFVYLFNVYYNYSNYVRYNVIFSKKRNIYIYISIAEDIDIALEKHEERNYTESCFLR